MRIRWRTIPFYFFTILLSVGCTLGGSDSSVANQANGRPTESGEGLPTYIARLDNTRPRCTFAKKDSFQYDIHCRAVVIDAAGNESPATEITAGLSLNWGSQPVKLDGAEITSASCSVSNGGLNQNCTLALASGNATTIQMDLQILEQASGSSRNESDIILLPYSVTTFGLVPNIAQQVESVGPGTFGFRMNSMIPTQTYLDQPGSVCVMDNKVYFNTSNFIYVLNGNALQVYAGSTILSHESELSHRLRVRFAGGGRLACGGGAIYLSDVSHNRVLKISDSGPVAVVAAAAGLNQPTDLALGPDGSLFILDRGNYRVKKVDPGGGITSVYGEGDVPPDAIAVGPDGALIVANKALNQIRQFKDGNTIALAAGGLESLSQLSVDSSGTVYFSDIGQRSIRKVDPATYSLVTVATGFKKPSAMAFAKDNTLYVADLEARLISQVSPSGVTRVVAGVAAPKLDDEAVATAFLSPIGDVAMTADNSIVLGGNAPLRKISGENGVLNRMSLFDPFKAERAKNWWNSHGTNLAVAQDGSIYYADLFPTQIFKISAQSGLTVAIAGTSAQDATTEDGAPALLTKLGGVGKMAVGNDGTVYFNDGSIKKIFLDIDGISKIKTLTGASSMGAITGMAVLPDNSLVVSSYNNRIYRVTTVGEISVIAGTGVAGSSGDGGPALQAQFSRPLGIAASASGILYIADSGNGSIRVLRPSETGYTVSTLFGGNIGKDCGTIPRIEGKSSAADLDKNLNISVSSLCPGSPVAIHVKDTCASGGELTFVYAQKYDVYYNVVKATRSCN